ncbi:hypothetical protein ACEU2D_23070 [Brevibacillus laterosporus]|uniref:hypothetical protein n=1 Tax=Brevibacillus laterosporus TaxID=1465 RepID=UPI0035A65ED9
MYVNFGKDYMSISQFVDRSELQSYLSHCDESVKTVLGNNCEQPKEFFAVTIYQGNESKRFGIGIISESFGNQPHILIMPNKHFLIVGYNRDVAIFNFLDKSFSKTISLGSVFFKFIQLHEPEYNLILILHELGLLAITDQGKEVWKYDCDIIENYHITNGFISLSTMDEQTVKIGLLDGKIYKY